MVLTIFRCRVQACFKYIHSVHSPPSISRTISSCRTESLSPLNTNSPSPNLCTHPPTFCLYKYDPIRGLTWNSAVFVLPYLAYFTHCNILIGLPCWLSQW